MTTLLPQIFYCDPCGDERHWPRRIVHVKGRCQICGEECMGSQVPRDILPTPSEVKGQLKLTFDWHVNGKLRPRRGD